MFNETIKTRKAEYFEFKLDNEKDIKKVCNALKNNGQEPITRENILTLKKY